MNKCKIVDIKDACWTILHEMKNRNSTELEIYIESKSKTKLTMVIELRADR